MTRRTTTDNVARAYEIKLAEEIKPGDLGVPDTLISTGFQRYMTEHSEDIVAFVLGEVEKEVFEMAEEQGIDDPRMSSQWKILVQKTLNRVKTDADVGSI